MQIDRYRIYNCCELIKFKYSISADYKTLMKDFQILNKLGDGAFSVVYKVKRISDGMEYALKKVKMAGLTIKERENAVNEVRILASIR